MALMNIKKKEINAKIVYYGPGLSGKTTNIQFIHSKLKPDHRGKLMTLATQTDRTLFFDFLPVELGEIRGMKTRFQIYTVPGQVFYNATRKLVLKNVDGVVFVADSQRKMLDDNIESLKNLQENLAHYDKSMEEVPIVIQYNKRDLPDAMSIEELNEVFNTIGAPNFEAVAAKGKGVLQTLTTISKLVLHKLKDSTEFAKIQQQAEASDLSKGAPAKKQKLAVAPTPPPAVEIAEPAIEIEEPEIELAEPAIEIEEPAIEVAEEAIEIEIDEEPIIDYEEPEEVELAEPEMEIEEPAIEAEELAIEVDDSELEIEMEEPAIEVAEDIIEEPEIAVAVPAGANGKFEIVDVGKPQNIGGGSFRLSLKLKNSGTEQEINLNLMLSLEDLS
jgi:mutual gliding-motility protein MglA